MSMSCLASPVTMAVDPMARRVALLARPGAACERLRSVLDEGGMQCVLVADPTGLVPAELLQVQPQVVLIALDPFTEEVLERFDAILGDTAIDVIYEEADLAVEREGWAIARWQRHLIAKLHGHADVLPPGRESEAAAPAAAETQVPATASAPGAMSYGMFDPVSAELDETSTDLAGDLPDAPSGPQAVPAPTFELDAVFDAPSFEAGDTAPLDALFDDSIDIDPPPATAASQASQADGIDEIAFDIDPVLPHMPMATEAQAETTISSVGMTLDPMSATGGADREGAGKFRHDLDDIERRISTLELVDDLPKPEQDFEPASASAPAPAPAIAPATEIAKTPAPAPGAVLVLSGIGGPDAVRQLLGALPGDFARPVLVQQRLDGGRYDKLVTQLQRATRLPVQLAVPGQSALAGTVHILPASLGLEADDHGIRFTHDPDENVLAALPSADSAVLLLSGSDPAQVDAALRHSWAGALVAGQEAEGCYDPAAPNTLAARGGDTAPPAALALRLAERWSS